MSEETELPVEEAPDVYEDTGHRVVQDAGVIIGVLAALGVVCGVVWLLMVDPAQKVRVDEGIGQNEIELARMFAYDGWYAVIAAPVSLLAGMVLTTWRAQDPRVSLVSVLLGCVIAALLMQGVGWIFGPEDPMRVLADAPVGTVADVPLEVSGVVTYLAWPIPALLGCLISLLSHTD